jgi:serine/threonine protein kinase
MPPGRPRSDHHHGDPLDDPSLEKPLSALRALAGSQYGVLGPLGRDAQGEHTFLARHLSLDVLVVLKRERSAAAPAAEPGTLQVITELDSSVPPPAGSCPVCHAPFTNWEPLCPECGANVAGAATTALGASPEQAFAAVRKAAEGYEVLGTMKRAVGGASVFFARAHPGGHLVALRLEDGSEQGQAGYTITATRMTQPKLLYGAVGNDASRDSGSAATGGERWTPVPSPSFPIPVGQDFPRASLDRGSTQKVCPRCNQTFGPGLRLCPHDGTALRPVATTDSLVGRIIADRYHIIDRLGQGGMGTVYLAEHVRMGRRCAVKVMNSTLLNDPDSLDRFTREAKNASLLNHPHVASVYDFGETSDGIVYLAMEFVEGESLAAVLDRVQELPEQQAVQLASQVADGLNAAHEMGIVHRDLKPDNIMVCHSKSGKLRVKVVDFGIAKATQGGRQTVTRTGYVVGTPAYMSPEQILGDPLDGRSDLYSLGCILYEMLTGQRAFSSSSGEVSIRRRLTEAPPPPRRVKQSLSKSLDDVVTRAMARAPEQRFRSAAELRDALLTILQQPTRKAGRQRWLPWSHPNPAPPAEEQLVVARTPQTTPQASLISPAPFLPPQLDQPLELSAEAAWPDPAAAGTRLRHRSARSEGSATGWLIRGAVATLTAVFAVFLFRGGELAGYWAGISRLLAGRNTPVKSKPVAQRAAGLIELPGDTATVAAETPPRAEQPSPRSTAVIRLTKPLPPGSSVTVDSIPVPPTTEGLVTVEPGPHVVRVRAPGHRSARRTIRGMAAGDTVQLDLVLLPLPLSPAEANQIDTLMGAIVVRGDLPSGSVIRIDGRVMTPGSRVLTASAGSHWVALSAPGYQTDSIKIDVEEGSWSDWPVPTLAALADSVSATDSVPPGPLELPDGATAMDSVPLPR